MDNFIKSFRENGFTFSHNADNKNGTFTNPIIHTDFSDPDVIEVDGHFYMTASSFSNLPALPILHSKDLVNWETINYAVKDRLPFDKYDKPHYGHGVWAPSIRYNNGYFYIYFGMPDEGIFVTRTNDIYGDWEPLKCIKSGRGYIDTCPFWDEDGEAYLVHGFAKSRIGFKSVLAINKMAKDGLSLTDEFRIVFDGNVKYPTIEGPKLYKRNGFYYILAPALGVTTGVQVALRSKNIYGPYEDRVVLEQGDTITNGPHQGGLVTANGKDYFIHFQDKFAYGRIPHLQPVEWIDDFPFMGEHNKAKDLYQPVITYEKPLDGEQVSDIYSEDFRSSFNQTFQWNCNINKANYSLENYDFLRLFAKKSYDETHSILKASNLLTQKFPNNNFTVTTKLNLSLENLGEKAGFGILSDDYSTLNVTKTLNGYNINHVIGKYFKEKEEVTEAILETHDINSNEIYLRINVAEINKNAVCTFSFSTDSENFTTFKNTHIATTSTWVGAKTFLYALSDFEENNSFVDVDYVVFE